MGHYGDRVGLKAMLVITLLVMGVATFLISSQLLASTGGSWSISLYVMAMATESFVCISLLSETCLTGLAEIRAEERRLISEARESAAG